MKTKNLIELFRRLSELGFTYDESAQLRRIEMTLHRWGEQECGDANGNCIERDEATGKPYMTREGTGMFGKRNRWPIADREAGALKRLGRIIAARNDRKPFGAENLVPYHQTDPRGCALYILRESSIPGGQSELEANYTRGVAVAA